MDKPLKPLKLLADVTNLYTAAKILQVYDFYPLEQMTPICSYLIKSIKEDMLTVIDKYEQLYPLDAMLAVNKLVRTENIKYLSDRITPDQLNAQDELLPYLSIFEDKPHLANHVACSRLSSTKLSNSIQISSDFLGIQPKTIEHLLSEVHIGYSKGKIYLI